MYAYIIDMYVYKNLQGLTAELNRVSCIAGLRFTLVNCITLFTTSPHFM